MASASRVTLVTPTYNQAQFLAETLDSVLAQSHLALEYVVIDDGSTDNTQEILRRYSGRINSSRQRNQGQSRTLNDAWASAKGDYLGYLSSDDLLRPTAVARMAEVLDNDPSIVCAFPNSDLIDLNSRILRHSVCRPFDLESTVIQQECHVGPGALFRRKAFECVGGWRTDLRLGPDREFWIRLASLGRIHFVQDSLALYRTHPASTSFSAASEEVSQEYVHVLDDFFSHENVPPRLIAKQHEAYAHASLLLARHALWRGEFNLARRHHQRAIKLHPPLGGLKCKLQFLRHSVSKPLKVIHARVTSALRGS